MKKFKSTAAREQITLLPRTIDEFVGKEDLVRYVDMVVEELDLLDIEGQYSAFGRPAYSPRVLVKVILYGKMRGIRSSRELSTACRENLRFIFLASDERPDFRTISGFRKRFHRELSELLRQTIEIGVKEDIIKLEYVAIDGTRIGASAGRNSFRSASDLKKRLSELEQEIKQSFARDIEADNEDDDLFGNDDGSGGALTGELQKKEALRDKIKGAIKHFTNIRENNKPKKISITDPESRYMRSKGTNPAYACLAAVDSNSYMVVAGYANNAVSDNAELRPSLEEVARNTGKNPKIIGADAAFRAREGILELKKRNIDGYVTMPRESEKRFTISDFRYDAEKDSYACPNNNTLLKISVNSEKDTTQYKCEECQGCAIKSQCLLPGGNFRTLTVWNQYSLVREMNEKNASAFGIEMAKKRTATVEPVFGYIKASKKLRQFLFRGMNMINSMWKLELAAYNIEKLAKHFRIQRLSALA